MNNFKEMGEQAGTLNRRDFVRAAAQATAAATAITAFPFVSRARVVGANGRIGVGFIGAGGRGNTHLAVVQRLKREGEQIQVVAINDAFRYRLEEAAKPTGARTYRKHYELLGDPNVDVVCIATPDRLHVPQAMDAIRAGKDLYCEKPMGHWSQFDLCRQFAEETLKLKRIVQVGNQGNSSPAWAKVRELVQRGAIGRLQHVQAGYFRRNIRQSLIWEMDYKDK